MIYVQQKSVFVSVEEMRKLWFGALASSYSLPTCIMLHYWHTIRQVLELWSFSENGAETKEGNADSGCSRCSLWKPTGMLPHAGYCVFE